MLAALWRILSGEQLKMGDAKLEEIFEMVEVLMTDLGNPLAVISVNHPRLFKLVNHLGILQTIPYNRSMINFTGSVLTDHKKRHIDGNNILFFFSPYFKCPSKMGASSSLILINYQETLAFLSSVGVLLEFLGVS